MAFSRAIHLVPYFFFNLSASISIKKVNWAQVADTIILSDKVVTVQARTKTSQRLLTYDTQTLSSTCTISNKLRDLNDLIFTPFKIHGENEKYQNHAKAHYSTHIREWRKDTKKIL